MWHKLGLVAKACRHPATSFGTITSRHMDEITSDKSQRDDQERKTRTLPWQIEVSSTIIIEPIGQHSLQ